MRLIKKIVLAIAITLLVGVGTQFYLITRGLSAGKQVVINEIDLSLIDDGSYVGSYDVGRWANEILVEVSDHRITDIKITKSVTYEDQEQTQALLDKVMEEQSTMVDAVAGATVTSKAYLKSIENAFSQ